ncbi:hypothetical protein TEA_015995 [Camellia sinensis var. sinensis]|uniref:Ubiquitin-like domain-containing protein n=1 Tax=Camellia sinensis var. sinensis TaxID=542762 RepID=A0A4S4DQG4_CAMSN|nr:hypothetical protein TEA_015995 [Camellia sinensis var. sinensis]
MWWSGRSCGGLGRTCWRTSVCKFGQTKLGRSSGGSGRSSGLVFIDAMSWFHDTTVTVFQNTSDDDTTYQYFKKVMDVQVIKYIVRSGLGTLSGSRGGCRSRRVVESTSGHISDDSNDADDGDGSGGEINYDGWKLLADSEPISNYGISDGDQLHFVRHVSVNYNLIRSRPPKDRLFALEQLKISDARLEGGQKDEKDDSSDDQENSPPQHYDDRNEDIMSSYESKLSQLFGRWFAYRRLGNPRRKVKGSSFSSRWTDDFLGSFRSIVRLYSSNKLKSQTDPSEEV